MIEMGIYWKHVISECLCWFCGDLWYFNGSNGQGLEVKDGWPIAGSWPRG